MRGSSGKSTVWIVVLTLTCILLSALVTFSMIVVTFPGDECLLFVGVRGEALIYGNPTGCNFVAYGHVITAAGALVMLMLLFCRRRKGFMKREPSNRTLRGTISSQPTILQKTNWNTPSEYGFSSGRLDFERFKEKESRQLKYFYRFSRYYSTKPIILAVLLAMFSLVIALVAISGYFITCDELEYEAQRQINQRLPLGK